MKECASWCSRSTAISFACFNSFSIASTASRLSTSVAWVDSNGSEGIGSNIPCTGAGYRYFSISTSYGWLYLYER